MGNAAGCHHGAHNAAGRQIFLEVPLVPFQKHQVFLREAMTEFLVGG